jgi:hypothetical protein
MQAWMSGGASATTSSQLFDAKVALLEANMDSYESFLLPTGDRCSRSHGCSIVVLGGKMKAYGNRAKSERHGD